jgi:ABC-type lipoprotein release transport system permease subunit
MLLKLASRNIWRNTRRTTISLLALALGVTAIVTIHSFREVAHEEMIRSVTRGLIGHLQVHGLGYQESPETSNVVRDAAAVETRLRQVLPGAETERRVLGAGLAGAGDAAAPVMVMGIEPGNPGSSSLLAIEAGRGLGGSPRREVVLGTGLARELGVSPGGEMILVAQAADGSLANDRFEVVGTADAGSSQANLTAVFLHLSDAQSFFAVGEGVHQVVVRLPTEEEDLSHPVSLLRGAVDLSALEVLAWTDILPDLKSAIDAKRKNSRVIDVIVFLIVALGVLNTMTMSTFERTREFGVMSSLGTRRGRILAMVLVEAVLQGIIGFTLGVAFSWALLHGMGTADLSAFAGSDMLGARMPDMLRLSVHHASVTTAALTTLLTMLSGALLPAIRASRLKPVEATRYV